MKPSLQDIEPVDHDLDLEESLELHVRRWRLRRHVALLLFALVILAWLGLFGDGPLSHAEQAREGSSVRYERFMRFNKTVQMEFRLGAGTGTIRLPRDYLEHFRIEGITPEPQSQQAGEDGIRFVFDAPGGATVRFHLLPGEVGLAKARISVNGVAFQVTQFVYP